MGPPQSPQPSAMMSDGDKGTAFVTPDPASDSGGGGGVKEPTDSDVLCGRGGSINSHPGNERFRTLVEKRKRVYLTARFKREKRLIASSIVQEIRDLDPPGRFLLKDSKSGLWKDIGDEKARDKTSQALRENAPSIRAEIETEINEQRAEQLAQDEKSRKSGPPHPHAPSPPYYGGPGWGYHSYYGYSHHAPPPPPGHGGPPPHPGQYPPPPYEGAPPPPPPPHWGQPPPPSYYGSGGSDPYHPHPPPPPKSTLEKTADYVASGAESLKNWTMSIGGGGGTGNNTVASIHSSSSHDSRSVSSNSAHSKKQPIVYVHEGESRKRRVVKFRDDRKHRRKHPANHSPHRPHAAQQQQQAHAPPPPQQQQQTVPRPNYSPIHNSGNNSLLDVVDVDYPNEEHEPQQPQPPQPHSEVQVIEPHKLDATTDDQNSSLMTQFANQVLGSIGSWDAAATICGTVEGGEDKVPFPDAPTSLGPSSIHADSHHHHHDDQHQQQQPVPQAATDEEMNMEWEEGQEVQLLEQKPDYDSADERMPPPVQQRPTAARAPPAAAAPAVAPDANTSIGFSSIGSCHSWLPEQFGSAAGSFFGGSLTNMSRGGAAGAADSTVHSMDMGGGTEQYSAAGSLGGGSLTRVFENSTHDYSSPQPASRRGSMGSVDCVVPQPASRRGSMGSTGGGVLDHRGLVQVPSWERSLRSRSPVSQAGSEDHDDQSLMSKASSKMSESMSVSQQPPPPPQQQQQPHGGGGMQALASPSSVDGTGGGGMVWETRE